VVVKNLHVKKEYLFARDSYLAALKRVEVYSNDEQYISTLYGSCKDDWYSADQETDSKPNKGNQGKIHLNEGSDEGQEEYSGLRTYQQYYPFGHLAEFAVTYALIHDEYAWEHNTDVYVHRYIGARC
jgi:hypothetical protein